MARFRDAHTRLALVALSVGIILCSVSAGAQDLPHFSGTWEQIGSSDPAITNQEQTVVHSPTALTIGHPSPRGGHKFLYKLDGTESRSTLMNIESVASVSVHGDKLTISRIDTYPDGRIRENTQVWSLDPGGRLVIESTDGLKGAIPATRKVVYKKRALLK
jgi:hypothetical protein